ncbi:MAG: hypothetical protein SNJ77_06305 [Cytophagales bacterium]
MKSDIDFPKVSGVLVVVVLKKDDHSLENGWYAYILNRNEVEIKNVMVSSKGYGFINEEKRSTSVLRHFIGNIEPGGYALIEPISDDVLPLNNEFWVSYYMNESLFDKKFIFVPDSIVVENTFTIPELNLQGVVHS